MGIGGHHLCLQRKLIESGISHSKDDLGTCSSFDPAVPGWSQLIARIFFSQYYNSFMKSVKPLS